MMNEVLLVDDNPGVLFLHELMIEESEFSNKVVKFERAGQALLYTEQAAQNDVVLVFLDLNMPVMNGWEYMNKIAGSNFYKNVLVIIVTSSINKADRIQSEKYEQIIGFIEKPFSVDDCLELKKHDALKKFFQE